MKLSKEIRFLHDFCELVEKEPGELNILYSELIRLLPKAMTHPECCLCTLNLDDQFFGPDKDGHNENCLKEAIFTKEQKIGALSIWYTASQFSFTSDECELIRYVCKRLGRIIERHLNKNQLDKALEELKEKKRKLDIKEIALAELLSQFNNSQSVYKKKVAEMIYTNILPNIDKLEELMGANFYIELLKLNIYNLVSCEDELLYQFTRLSQREIECCYLISKGLTSKEIANRLLISSKTVDKHRANIRNKLGMIGNNKNLYASLQFIDQN